MSLPYTRQRIIIAAMTSSTKHSIIRRSEHLPPQMSIRQQLSVIPPRGLPWNMSILRRSNI